MKMGHNKEIILLIASTIICVSYMVVTVKSNNIVSANSLSDNSIKEVGEEKWEVYDSNESISENSASDDSVYGTHRVEEIDNNEIEGYKSVSDITSSDKIKDTVIKEINLIKSGDKATVEKWYGRSDIYTTKFISDVASRVVVNFIDNTLTSDKIRLHMCCVQYDDVEKAMREELNNGATEEEANNKVAQMILNGDFNKCYNVVIGIDTQGIIPNEELKTVMSCLSYNTVDIKETKCLVEEQRDKLGYE